MAEREHDALVASYRHLPELPRAADALLTLRKIASVVKPIMRARGWRVSELCEFYPSQQNLLGKMALKPTSPVQSTRPVTDPPGYQA